jgi:hypothetical protein
VLVIFLGRGWEGKHIGPAPWHGYTQNHAMRSAEGVLACVHASVCACVCVCARVRVRTTHVVCQCVYVINFLLSSSCASNVSFNTSNEFKNHDEDCCCGISVFCSAMRHSFTKL